MAEYLFRRSSILHGGGSLRSSTFLCDRALLDLEPGTGSLSRHQDWDWALRAGGWPDVAFRVCPEVLVEVGPPDASSISASGDWRASLDWLEQSAAYLNPRERGDFLLCTVAALAARSGSRPGQPDRRPAGAGVSPPWGPGLGNLGALLDRAWSDRKHVLGAAPGPGASSRRCPGERPGGVRAHGFR